MQTRPIRILSVFGTRPEAIKMAPVVRALAADARFDALVCTTGQHAEMLDQVMAIFGMKADHDLAIMREGQGLTHITTSVLAGLEPVLAELKPDWVLVHGDTTTSMAAALAAFYAGVRVGHVEAGLRTGNLLSPWPEEANRQITGRLATLHFAPTAQAEANLLAEAVDAARIHVTGNTVIDALHIARDQLMPTCIERDSCSPTTVCAEPVEALVPGQRFDRLSANGDGFNSMQLGITDYEQAFSYLDPAKRLILVTGHRRENHDGGIARVCEALAAIAARGDVQIVYPVHLNPKVKAAADAVLASTKDVFLIEPQSYLPFVWLMDRSALVVTDSGGIQEEAPSLGKPVIVTRDTTERPEAVAAGTAILAGTDRDGLVAHVNRLLDDSTAYAAMAQAHNPYGDGKAAARILEALAHA